MPASQSIGQGNTNSRLPVIIMFFSQCQSCHGILDYSCSEGLRDHRALLFHFIDRETETWGVEVSSLRFYSQWYSESLNRPGFSLLSRTFEDSSFCHPPLCALLSPSTFLPHGSVSSHQLMHFHFQMTASLLVFLSSAPTSPSPFLPRQEGSRTSGRPGRAKQTQAVLTRYYGV